MKQLKLFNEKQQLEFGGSLNKGKRMTQRPLAAKTPHHLVLKAEDSNVLLPNKNEIEMIISKLSKKFCIPTYNLAVHADHVHIPLGKLERGSYTKWIRSVTGVLSRRFKIKWQLRPYSKIISWGRQFDRVIQYVEQNKTEGSFLLAGHNRMAQYRKEVLEEWENLKNEFK